MKLFFFFFFKLFRILMRYLQDKRRVYILSCLCLTEVFSRKDRDKGGKTFFENIAAKHVLNFLIR